MTRTILHGDCIAVMQQMDAESIDAIVTDPPYGLGFMGKQWDDLPPGEEWARECLRVLKPGGHLLAFGGTRTWHRLAVAVEDAGFEIRDSIAWMHGSGFPKSLNVSAAIDRAAPPSPELLPDEAKFCEWMRSESGLTADAVRRATGSARFLTGEVEIVNTATREAPRLGRRAMVPTSEAWSTLCGLMPHEPPEWVSALVKNPPKPPMQTPSEWKAGSGNGTAGTNDWQGWGTALKPAHEPIIVARKPLRGTVAANVLQHGTGALNIDGCRIGDGSGSRERVGEATQSQRYTGNGGTNFAATPGVRGGSPSGRWPANVVLDEDQAAALDAQSGTLTGRNGGVTNGTGNHGIYGKFGAAISPTYRDSGGASRFFFVTNEDPCKVHEIKRCTICLVPAPDVGNMGERFKYCAKAPKNERPVVDGVAHPTVKPLSLMRWLVRLATPPGGTVLDPFAGSGTTIEAAILEGFSVIGVEREAEYLPLIKARIERARS